MEQILTIDIFGESYQFETDSNAEKAKKVVDFFVEEVMKAESAAVRKTPDMAKFTILIIAALNIANQNFELKTDYTKLIESVSAKASDLVQMMAAIPE